MSADPPNSVLLLLLPQTSSILPRSVDISQLRDGKRVFGCLCPFAILSLTSLSKGGEQKIKILSLSGSACLHTESTHYEVRSAVDP